MKTALALLTLVLSAILSQAQPSLSTILLLVDGPDKSCYDVALYEMGLPYQLFTTDADFSAALSSADPSTTLALVDSTYYLIDDYPVAQFVNDGGRVLLQYWHLSPNSTLPMAFEVTVVGPIPPLGLPVYNWFGSPLFDGVSNPLDVDYGWVLGYGSHALEPAAGGQAVAGFTPLPGQNEAAIVIGNSGRTVINGFLLEDEGPGAEAVAFAQNEIQFLLGPTNPAAPSIIKQPQGLTVVAGETASFSVVADGTPPLSFQWFFDQTNTITQATNATLTIPNIHLGQAGDYGVRVTNLYGAVTSELATLTVQPAPWVQTTVTNCTEADLRTAMVGGGTVTFACNGTITLSNTVTITSDMVLDASGHRVTISGGAAVRVFYVNPNVTFAVVNLTIANGLNSSGGGIYNDGGTVNATNCTFSGNAATGPSGNEPGANGTDGCGGALYNAGVLNASLCAFLQNSAAGGQGWYGWGDVWGSVDAGHGGAADGGAIFNLGVMAIDRSLFASNSAAAGSGGGGLNGDQSSSGFSAGGPGGAGGAGSGGALFNGGEARVANCTFAWNQGTGGSGGRGGAGSVLILPPTYEYWPGGPGGDGGSGFGGICDTNGSLSLTNCTLAFNSGNGGAGGIGGAGDPIGASGANGSAAGGLTTIGGSLVNTLLATNAPGGNGAGTVTDGGHNLSSDGTCSFANTGSVNDLDPMIGPLTDNGGPTLTMALLPGSPAIDAGDSAAAPPTDQRGFPRPVGAAADIGAYEFWWPAVLQVSRPQGGGIDIVVYGTCGQFWRLLTSTTLSNWMPVATNRIGTNGTILFHSSGVDGAQRFYRVASP